MQGRKSRRKKVKEDKAKINIKEKMTELLELPKEIVLDLPKTTIVGSNNVIIENYKGIIEYDSARIRANTSKGIIKISGSNLVIREITSEDLMIEGDIDALEFLK
ncbi:MAG: sporulation protein YqfC [Clostridiaceae bacterium]|nr:sporulation protein YqfC [Clostridiaceae bacterium]